MVCHFLLRRFIEQRVLVLLLRKLANTALKLLLTIVIKTENFPLNFIPLTRQKFDRLKLEADFLEIKGRVSLPHREILEPHFFAVFSLVMQLRQFLRPVIPNPLLINSEKFLDIGNKKLLAFGLFGTL